MSQPKVKITEVGPRDGLQNEPGRLSVATKVSLVQQLQASGLTHIEVGSFVNPARVVQMADSDEVIRQLLRHDLSQQDIYSALVPNLKGYERAIDCGIKEIAVFASASEGFSQHNIQCSVDESIARFIPVMSRARQDGMRVRGYVSCVFGCPYEGLVTPEQVRYVTEKLLELGCYEISLGDTIGVGTQTQVAALLGHLQRYVSADKLAVHFHDTYGQALVNIAEALQLGIRSIDASVAGLGGCPYADGASGNVATEDLVYMLEGMGYATGIHLESLCQAGAFICKALGRANGSKVAQAMLS